MDLKLGVSQHLSAFEARQQYRHVVAFGQASILTLTTLC